MTKKERVVFSQMLEALEAAQNQLGYVEFDETTKKMMDRAIQRAKAVKP